MKISAYHPFRSEEAKSSYLALYNESAKNWSVPSEGKMINSSYGQTFVRVSGPIDAPPLVLLPGAGTCSLMWSPSIEDLSKNHRSYAVDSLINTGCVGRSVFTRAITTSQDVIMWLNELFNGLGLSNNISLVGASYGGWSASQYALHCPERLSKMVLIAPAGTILPFSGAYLLRTILLGIVPLRFTYERFFSWSFPDLAQHNKALLEAIIDEFMVSARCFVPPNPQELPRLSALTDDELQRIKLPTLVLLGENEVLYSAQEALKRIHLVAPHIQSEMIPHAGHDLLLVQTEMVNRKILEFLEQSS